MSIDENTTDAGTQVPATGSHDPATREQIQIAVNNLVAGRAGPAEYEVLTDRDVMGSATGEQCCSIIDALAKMSEVTPEVWKTLLAASRMLKVRYQQSPRLRSREAPRVNGRRQFPGPQLPQSKTPEVNEALLADGDTGEIDAD